MDKETLMKLVAKVAHNELNEDELTREQILEEFRVWIANNDNIIYCRTDDSFLLRFLRKTEFNLPLAQKFLLRFIKVRETYSNIMCDLDIQDPEINDVLSSGFHFCSPFRDDNGREVVFTVFGKLDTTRHTFEQMYKTLILGDMVRLEDDVSQVLGFTWVYDLAGISLQTLSLVPVALLLKLLGIVETASAVRMKKMHVVNMPTILWFIYNMIKGVLNKKTQESFVIHRSIEELQQEVNPRCLPLEYGGTIPLSEINAQFKESLIPKRQVLLDLDKIKLRDLELVEL